jgi:hypothetical protein
MKWSMITTENLHELMKLKLADRDAFYKLLEEMSDHNPVDILLSYKKFKEYAANV